MHPFAQTVQLYDWANRPATSTTDQAPISNRPGAGLYTTTSGVANQGGVLALGSDYGTTPKAQTPRIDANGVASVADAFGNTAGTAVASPRGPVVMGMASGVARPLQLDALQNLVVAQDTLPTFSAVAAGVSIAANKSMAALVNGSTSGTVLRLAAVYAVNSSTTTGGLGVTFNIYAAELRSITGVSASGTSVTVLPFDSSDALDPNVKAYSGATVTGDTQGPLRRWVTSSFGLSPNATNAEAHNAEHQGRVPWVSELGGMAKAITIRPGAGVHVKIATAASAGFLDVTFVFTQAPA